MNADLEYFPGSEAFVIAARTAVDENRWLGCVWQNLKEPQFWMAWMPALGLLTEGATQVDAFTSMEDRLDSEVSYAVDDLLSNGDAFVFTIERLPDGTSDVFADVRMFEVVTPHIEVLQALAAKEMARESGH